MDLTVASQHNLVGHPQQKGAMLAFVAGNLRMALPLQMVDRALFLPALTPMPGSPPWQVGVMHLGVEAITVLDLGLRMGFLRQQAYPLDTPLILCRDGRHNVALVVDEVVGLSHPTPLVMAEGNQAPLFSAVMEDANGPLMVLDLERVMDRDTLPNMRPVEAFVMPGQKG
uniref:Putative CheW-like protein n=1 Tax=Magnetococcus massalia (strain MO-1) TaxID=451514 RepID=A0A1S7LGY1_MAGMO|nr:putative CheW-like protein [Candidatus Magnetococcus massalia]